LPTIIIESEEISDGGRILL